MSKNSNNIEIPGSETPLTKAIKSKKLKAIDDLLNTPGTDLNTPNGEGDCPLTLAIKFGFKATTARLVAMGANFDLFYDRDNTTTIFIAAVENNNTLLVEEILKHKDRLTDSEMQIALALPKACKEDNAAMVEILYRYYKPVLDTTTEVVPNSDTPSGGGIKETNQSNPVENKIETIGDTVDVDH